MADERTRALRAAEEAAFQAEALEAELDALDTGAKIAPPAEVRDRVLWEIRGPGAEAAAHAIAEAGPDRGLATMIWALGVAASFMLAATFGALWYATRADLAATRENVARLETMVKERDRQISLTSQEISWLKDPRVQVALLKGLEGNPAARAKLLWNPGTKQGILWVSGLPPLPLEKSYELWAFVGDQPVPAGTFDATGDGATVIPISRQESFDDRPVKFAVSVEPKGGVPAPTGSIVLAGERF
ncbi:MAG TPA: anti-sigma factor [Thermoanaerobaculia bacterium]